MFMSQMCHIHCSVGLYRIIRFRLLRQAAAEHTYTDNTNEKILKSHSLH